MAIHLRDPRTPTIQFKTLCGLYIARMAASERFTYDVKMVSCETCKLSSSSLTEHERNFLSAVAKSRVGG